jgi:hypothetical protein
MTFNSYEDWRNTVPWTNAQIVEAMRAEADVHPSEFRRVAIRKWADHVETTGRLSAKALGFVLGRLVTVCEFCERKALYRLGNVGRCSKHRDIKNEHTEARARRLQFKHAMMERRQKAFDRNQLEALSHHRSLGRKTRGFK